MKSACSLRLLVLMLANYLTRHEAAELSGLPLGAVKNAVDKQSAQQPCIAESSSWGLSPTAPHSNREGAGLRDETPQTAGNLRSTGACLRIDNTVREVPY